MASFTLQDIVDAAERQFGSTEIQIDENTTVTLVNVVRLPREKRQRLIQLQKELDGEGKTEEELAEVDQVPLLEESLRLVAKTEAEGDKLIAALGGDLALLASTFSFYGKETEVGEA